MKILFLILGRLLLYTILIIFILGIILQYINLSSLFPPLYLGDGEKIELSYGDVRSNYWDIVSVNRCNLIYTGALGRVVFKSDYVTLLFHWMRNIKPVPRSLIIGPAHLDISLNPDAGKPGFSQNGKLPLPGIISCPRIEIVIRREPYMVKGIFFASTAASPSTAFPGVFQCGINHLEIIKDTDARLNGGTLVLQTGGETGNGSPQFIEFYSKWEQLDLEAFSRDWKPDQFFWGGKWKGALHGRLGNKSSDYLNLKMELLKPGGVIYFSPSFIDLTIRNMRKKMAGSISQPVADAISEAFSGTHYSDGSVEVIYQNDVITLDINLKTKIRGQPYIFEIKFDIGGATRENLLTLWDALD